VRIHLINLDRSSGRLAEFTARNGHLRDVSRFSAVDGTQVNRGDLVKRGIIEPSLDYTDGALGNALSHFALWELAISTNEPLTLCEDDAIFNKSFEIDAAILASTLRSDWHIIFWGWNFDAFALFELIPGVSPFLANFNQDQMRQGIDQFQSATLSPRPFRLLAAFGIVCYTISPLGARRLRQACIPLQSAPVFVQPVNRSFENKDLSVALLDIFQKINAFASFPPLVITKNDHATSTVLAPQSAGFATSDTAPRAGDAKDSQS
jgi:GR25 family glycosyltransferase involved in LPS biosynthesis